ncbi:MAG: adenylate/guanylate cyclase domain-containing protein [Minwuia sp.]|nr:adenylate/guanylate cyclase domain-containing protein [Minwuia sp.]
MHYVNRARLISGLILFAFVATHLLNHALGIISLPAMEAGREIFILVWRAPLMTVVLIAATVVHMALALFAVYRRRIWRGISLAEVIQLVTGFALPPLLVVHVLANRGLHDIYGLDDTYAWVLVALWHLDPLGGLQQAVVVILSWAHGCTGIHRWLRLKQWYRPCIPGLYTAALLTVILSLIGFVNGGQEVVVLLDDPVWRSAYLLRTQLPGEASAWLYAARDTAWMGMIITISVVGLARGIHLLIERQRKRIVIQYPGGQKAAVLPGLTILETSRRAGVSHASICGGRGRCSTCRVKVLEGLDNCPEPEEIEARVLRRLGAAPGVRLACQVRPTGDLRVYPLLPAPATSHAAYSNTAGSARGAEECIAILFADIRGFTQFSQQKLPYDVVFLINQYFRYMGEAVERNGGKLDKFIGDGVMALFGIGETPEAGARKALAAARAMSVALNEMNDALRAELGQPLRIGIGIEIGDVVVGEMGYRNVMSVTAIGAPVNVASRLEDANKDHQSQIIFSEAVAVAAGMDMDGFPVQDVNIRGDNEAVPAYVLHDARAIPPIPGSARKGTVRT